MKILYSVQATGNGHIARAAELIPVFQQYGNVDVFLSGSNSSLHLDLPVKYRSKGLSLFYGNRGGLDYLQMIKYFSPIRIFKEARALPVQEYDAVINDFDSITALSCKIKNVPFIHFGHQASFASAKTPRPQRKDIPGELILRNYSSSVNSIGLHFKPYDNNIHSPVLKSEVIHAIPEDHGHITVYLSHYSDDVLLPHLYKIPDVHFHLFSKKAKEQQKQRNVTLLPVNNQAFSRSMINAVGVITGAGFETPAEALYLGKRLLCLPILGQYEQLCNAAALQQFGVSIINKIDNRFAFEIKMWLNGIKPKQLVLQHSTEEIVSLVMKKAISSKQSGLQQSSIFTNPDSAFPLQRYTV